MTVSAPTWGTLVLSTPILFGGNATAYGLTPNTVYYVASAPTPNADQTTYTFQISAQWLQKLSADNVPIQGSGGKPGPILDLLSPTGAGALTYGMVKPVTQLGSSQLAANQLAKNADGSLTMWFGPTLPAGAPASNWIPTPSTAYYSALYPNKQVSTAFQLTLRMHYPTPGNEPPSILPCTQSVRSGVARELHTAGRRIGPVSQLSSGLCAPFRDDVGAACLQTHGSLSLLGRTVVEEKDGNPSPFRHVEAKHRIAA